MGTQPRAPVFRRPRWRGTASAKHFASQYLNTIAQSLLRYDRTAYARLMPTRPTLAVDARPSDHRDSGHASPLSLGEAAARSRTGSRNTDSVLFNGLVALPDRWWLGLRNRGIESARPGDCGFEFKPPSHHNMMFQPNLYKHQGDHHKGTPSEAMVAL